MEHEAITRLTIFVAAFIIFAGSEKIFPRRKLRANKVNRWITNWSIVIIDTLLLRVLAFGLPLLAVGAALDAEQQNWGLFNRSLLPEWLEVICAILIFDFLIWFQHLVTHKVNFLWRIHRVHHADTDIDVTTAIRFHPIEIAFSMILKICAVYLIGPSTIAVILFEVILNASAMFNHANIKLSPNLDRIIRIILVTPDMHRVHHSNKRHEHDSNYGFSLSVWDRIFGTYRPQPENGHEKMTIGLEWQNTKPTKLGWSLWLPFRRN